MKEIGAERDWTIAPWDQTFCRNDRSFHVRYSYSANIVADVQFDRGLPIQFDRGLRKSYEISRPILAIESLSDAADFVDACAEYLENGTVPEVETCP